MPEAVLVSALRTPIGTAFKGTLRDTTAFDLAHHVVTAAAAGLAPDLIDDVILGEGLAGGGVVARHAAITAGLTSVVGLAHNRHCAAGLAAVQGAAASVRAGMDELIIAGGVNSASTAPRSRRRADGDRADGDWADWFPPTHPFRRRGRPDPDPPRAVLRRRAPAPRHQPGEAGLAEAAAPGDRGVQHHRGQRWRCQ